MIIPRGLGENCQHRLTQWPQAGGVPGTARSAGSDGSSQSGPNVGSEFYEGVTPIYEEVEGWQDTTLGIRAIKDLPAAARRYIHVVEEAVGAPVDIISTGPDRNETIRLNDPFADVE